MFTPAHFRMTEQEKELEAARVFVAAHPFAIVVVGSDLGPEAVHVPLIWRGDCLVGHVARANPIWQRFNAGVTALAIFRGPHAYISPDWYQSAGMVPTWNYQAVHVTGCSRLVADRDHADAIMADLVAAMEGALAKAPWALDRLSAQTRRGLERGIVTFEISATRIEAKAKLSQNRSPDDRAGVIAGLEAQVGEGRHAIAKLMRAL